jgi:hypothetical protein
MSENAHFFNASRRVFISPVAVNRTPVADFEVQSCSCLTPELTRPAQSAFNIMGQFNHERVAMAGSD